MLDLGSVQLDLDQHRVTRADGEDSLTQLEVDALRYFLARPDEVVLRGQLERDVWGFAPRTRSEAVPVAMRRLRKKVGEVLVTVKGEGWRLRRPVAPGVPLPNSPFFGREGTLSDLAGRLGGVDRLVVLRGPGGVGKTRVALEFARRWPGEVVLVSLAPLPEESLALRLADALRLEGSSDAAIRRGLTARARPLLVLDDADFVAPEIAPIVAKLVEDVLELRVLVTSRVALGVAGETVIDVAPFEPEVARAFFLDRLRGVHPDPTRELAALDEIVAALDRSAGALELYAGRAWIGLAPLADELREGQQDARLDAYVARSWEALDGPLQRTLLACSAFSGSFPPSAAVAAAGVEDAGAALDRVAELRRRSLLQLDAEGHLFLLEVIRRFCERQPGVAAARRSAHRWVLHQAEAACEALNTLPAASLRTLTGLRPHLDALARVGSPDDAARASLASSAALSLTGPTSLRVSLLSRLDLAVVSEPLRARVCLDLAQARRLTGASVSDVAHLIADLPGAEASLVRADHAVAAGDVPRALASYAEAITLVPAGHWVSVLARVRRCGATALLVRRDAAAVDEDVRTALDDCRRFSLARYHPDASRVAGTVATLRGDRAAARVHLSTALRDAETLGFARIIAELWNALALTWYLEDGARASECFERARRQALERGDEAYAAVFALNLAGIQLRLDRPAAALRSLELADVVCSSRVARQACALVRAGALFALGYDVDAAVALGAVEPAVIGQPFSPEAVAHGELLMRMMSAEATLRAWPAHPELGEGLWALLADAADERQRESGLMLRGLCERLEARLRGSR